MLELCPGGNLEDFYWSHFEGRVEGSIYDEKGAQFIMAELTLCIGICAQQDLTVCTLAC